jgi:parallel beta-helix repeat protein
MPLRHHHRRRSALPLIAAVLLLALCAGLAAAAALITVAGRTPREWAPYLERRAAGHNPLITGATDKIARFLLRQDRLPRLAMAPPTWAGASADHTAPLPARITTVAGVDELRAAVAAASPGDTLLLRPGTYVLDRPLAVAGAGGTQAAPITLRTEHLGGVILTSTAVAAINLAAPYWHIEDLIIEGHCQNDTDCEHAIHVVGPAGHTVLRNLILRDFNAAVKINAENNAYPDDGEIAFSTLRNAHKRDTQNPITPIDLVTANAWFIHDNLIADFFRAATAGPAATYGAFAKGGGTANHFDHNFIKCEASLHDASTPMIGLSLGGGGTGTEFCRGGAGCITEQTAGRISNNVIASCNDAGIYLNKAAQSFIEANTLLDTAGIIARFPETSADVTANRVDGPITSRDAAILRAQNNASTPLLYLFLGVHPQR